MSIGGRCTVFVAGVKRRMVSSSENRRQMGARPVLKRCEQTVEKELAKRLHEGSIPGGSLGYAVAS